MYDPRGHVLPYFGKALRTPDGWLFLLLVMCYVLAFIFFHQVVDFAKQYQVLVAGEYRGAFLLMPLLLLAVYLQMDITAKSSSDRVLTVVALTVVAAAPIFHIFR